jgi:hypothetical protein
LHEISIIRTCLLNYSGDSSHVPQQRCPHTLLAENMALTGRARARLLNICCRVFILPYFFCFELRIMPTIVTL